METPRHNRLKSLAATVLRAAGCAAIAFEVRCPASRYRADVAGFADPMTNSRLRWPSAGPSTKYSIRASGRATTVVVECKQSRADFLRDNRHLDRLVALRCRLHTRRREMETSLLPVCEPHLQRSESMLFADMEPWDFTASQSPAYRRLMRELRRVDEQIHGQTKFWLMARYAVADVLLIAAPAGMLRTGELPAGWGLLELSSACLEPGDDAEADRLPLRAQLRTAKSAPTSTDRHRMRLLRNIAVAGCQRLAPRPANPPILEVCDWVMPIENGPEVSGPNAIVHGDSGGGQAVASPTA